MYSYVNPFRSASCVPLSWYLRGLECGRRRGRPYCVHVVGIHILNEQLFPNQVMFVSSSGTFVFYARLLKSNPLTIVVRGVTLQVKSNPTET
jgi:hypothetical protein